MPVRLLLAVAFIALCTVGIGFYLSAENTGRFAWLTDALPGQATASQTTSSPTAASTNVPSQAPPPTEPPDNALGFMLASAAQQYAQDIRYPAYSLPLTEAQAEGYQGNRFDPVALPLPGDGTFTVTLEKFRFVADEPILVAASVTGQQVVSDTMTASLESAANRDILESGALARSADGFYEGQLTAASEPGEYRLIVEARIDGDTVRHASTLTIEPYLGDFKGLGDPDIRNNDLVIPVHFDAEAPGYYSLSAQLLDNGRPIALLNAEKRMDGSSNTIDLRAHGTVLAGKQVDGQLHIRHLQIRRLPAQPGDRTDYGFGPDEGYTFTPPDLESLTDTPASDPESEQRAALFQKLADRF
ncbi:AsmA family protein [Marinobacter confluentis]|uniref:Uncharacterized protein n=1 Tax=Marinobacter confluentis TaxID=1697557 RepID=A0A4Z1C505_9GAMM|nr:hypothetical protein [Marinobacter confluentis]TGN41491.1 hypothetical protein E5Q11_02850 [Marinobacter confluentis]